MRSQNITCDIYTQKADTIHYVQGEKGREIKFSFINSATSDTIDLTGLTVSIHILKSDGNFTIATLTHGSEYATYTLTDNDCIVGGMGVYDLSISDTNNIIYTAHGNYIGDNKAVADGTVNSISMAYGVPFPEGFQEKLIPGANITIIDNVISSTGGGGTTDYSALNNKPTINNVTLTGNKTSSDLGLQSTLTFDTAPTSQSNNPVTSDGIYDALTNKVNTSAIGAASGVAELDASGHVPSSQLPAYVDDVVEGYYYNNVFYEDASHTIPITGETGKIYIDLPNNLSYRWTGSGYTVISPSLALGETSSTAYRGDRGKIAYDTALANKDNIADDYNPGNTYNIGDYCLYNGVLYRCNTNATTGTFTPGHWDYAQICEDLSDIADDVNTLNSNMTKNVLDTYVDISGYASTNNKYTIPDDGYLEIGANGQTSQWNANFDGGLVMYVNGGYNSAWNIQSMFVRKGMQVYMSTKTGSGHARYFKLKSST